MTFERKASNFDEVPRFPLVRYICLMTIMLTNCTLISYIFPFIGFFVVHIGAAEDKVAAGYSAGIVISMFFLGRGISNIGWGIIADRYGRKFTLLISLICSTVCMAGFGFSTTLSQMIVWRFLAGFLNGVNSTSKVLSYEMASTIEHKNRGAAFLQAAWGTGLIVGTGIAGYLSEPCAPNSDLAGFFVDEHVFCVFPFSLPGIVLAMLHLVSFACLTYLPETAESPSTIRFSCSPYSTLPVSAEHDNTAFSRVDTLGKKQNTDLAQDFDSIITEAGAFHSKDAENIGIREFGHEPSERARASDEKPDGIWWCQGRFVMLVISNGLAVAGIVMAQELATLWAILPVGRGGPQWSEQTIGKAWVPLGVFLIFVQILLIPRIINQFGNEPSLKCGLVLQIFAQLTLPWVALANPAVAPDADETIEPVFLVMGLFLLSVASQQFLNQIIACTLTTLVSASIEGKHRGRAIGLSTAVQSTLMASSPMLAGYTLSMAVDRAGMLSADPLASFPGGTHPAFFGSSLMLVIPLLLVACCLPKDEFNRLGAQP